jgi:hypothetical protein
MAKTPQTSKEIVQKVAELLRSSDLTNEDRQLLTTLVLSRLGVLPLRASITVDATGQVFVNGTKPDVEVARQLRESAKSMLTSFARRFVRETTIFLAIKQGVHENLSPEQGLFAKAALWQMQEEQTLLELLAGTEGDDDS